MTNPVAIRITWSKNYLKGSYSLISSAVQCYYKFPLFSKIPKTFLSTSASHQNLPNQTHGDGKTTITDMNKDMKDTLMINSYSELGFRLNSQLFVVGPAVIFPKLILQWNVGNTADTITEESLSLFKTLDPPLDILVIGYGNANVKPNPRIVQFCLSNKINAEFLPTYQACTTFNFLSGEQRHVAAALIPPSIVYYKTGSTIAMRRKQLLEADGADDSYYENIPMVKR